jgi:hypothetical protein
LFIGGQSNSGNSGSALYVAGAGVVTFDCFDGCFYEARDPLAGALGAGGSPWGRLADKLVAAKLCQRVVLAPIGGMGSFVGDWAPGGQHFSRLQRGIDGVLRAGSPPTHVLWHQGEEDALYGRNESWPPNREPATGIPEKDPEALARDYQTAFNAIVDTLRRAGIAAPIFVARASYRFGSINPAVRRAQGRLIDPARGIFAGPDTDSIGAFGRYDDLHMNAIGLELHAELWLAALREPGSVFRLLASPAGACGLRAGPSSGCP